MPAHLPTGPEGPSQRDIYDERYRAGLIDRRSAVRVTTAEDRALVSAVNRVLAANPGTTELTWFDFGYGTGRVVNEFVRDYGGPLARHGLSLRIVAYDVSAVGLRLAYQRLQDDAALHPLRPFSEQPQHLPGGYLAGVLHGPLGPPGNGTTLEVTFVHADEREHPSALVRLVKEALDAPACLLTTSWYSPIGHVRGRQARLELLTALDDVTAPTGDLLLAVTTTGDLTAEQAQAAEQSAADRRRAGFESPQDLTYLTELGQANVWHVFGTDLNDHLDEVYRDRPDLHWWLEALRYPGEEFTSATDDLANFSAVRRHNQAKGRSRWTTEDFRACHSVLVTRTPVPTWAGPPVPTWAGPPVPTWAGPPGRARRLRSRQRPAQGEG
jgi:hypothetical protein